MKTKNALQNILSRFGKIEPENPLAQQCEGYSTITVDSKRTVRLIFDETKGTLQLISPVCRDNPEIYADMLELNMFRDQLAGARFILLRETDSLALLKHIEINDLTAQEFEVLFEEFLDIALKWSETFSNYGDSDDDNDSVPTLIMDDIFNRA